MFHGNETFVIDDGLLLPLPAPGEGLMSVTSNRAMISRIYDSLLDSHTRLHASQVAKRPLRMWRGERPRLGCENDSYGAAVQVLFL